MTYEELIEYVLNTPPEEWDHVIIDKAIDILWEKDL